jgi:hypothetical protein
MIFSNIPKVFVEISISISSQALLQSFSFELIHLFIEANFSCQFPSGVPIETSSSSIMNLLKLLSFSSNTHLGELVHCLLNLYWSLNY